MSNPITPEQRAACAKALEELHEGQRDVYEFAKDDACWWLAAYEARVIRLEAELEKSDRQVSELSSRMVTNVRRESRREVLRSLLRAERAASVDHNAPSRESVLIDRALAAEARVAELEAERNHYKALFEKIEAQCDNLEVKLETVTSDRTSALAARNKHMDRGALLESRVQELERALDEQHVSPELAATWATHGRTAERAAVVAWLRGRTGQPCDQHLDFADAIEAGAHLPGGHDE